MRCKRSPLLPTRVLIRSLCEELREGRCGRRRIDEVSFAGKRHPSGLPDGGREGVCRLVERLYPRRCVVWTLVAVHDETHRQPYVRETTPPTTDGPSTNGARG